MTTTANLSSTLTSLRNKVGENCDLTGLDDGDLSDIISKYVNKQYADDIANGDVKYADVVAFYTTGAGKNTIPYLITDLKFHYMLVKKSVAAFDVCKTITIVDKNFDNKLMTICCELLTI